MSPSPNGPKNVDIKITDVASVEIIGKVEETRAAVGGLVVPDHARATSQQLSLLVVIGMRDAHRNIYPAHAFRLGVANEANPDPGPTLDRFEAMIHGAIQKARMEWALAISATAETEEETDE